MATKNPTKTPDPTRSEAILKGRAQTTAVRAYLDALKAANAPKRRGRRRTPDTIQQRLVSLDAELSEDGLDVIRELKLIQERHDLSQELEELESQEEIDPTQFEADFVKVAKEYAERQGISAQAFRALGVPRDTLKKAGIV